MPRKSRLRLQFDHNLDFQLEANQAVVDVFQGLRRFDSAFTLGDGTVPNLPEGESLRETWLLDNLLAVQDREGIERVPELAVDEGMVLEGAGNEPWRYPSFTMEMETGTGKTYVYLRTIYELRKHYGFRKVIVVVPSIAICEGVVKSFEIIESAFRSLYSNETVNLIGIAMMKSPHYRGWLGWVGIFSAAGILFGLLEPAGVPLAGLINAFAYIVWAVWMVIVGIFVLRLKTNNFQTGK
jgi:restriction endonuclease